MSILNFLQGFISEFKNAYDTILHGIYETTTVLLKRTTNQGVRSLILNGLRNNSFVNIQRYIHYKISEFNYIISSNNDISS